MRLKSEEVYASSCALMPGGVSSPVRAFKGMPLRPLVVKEGRGDTLWDIDGHRYTDFCMGWGALILGHSPEPVTVALREQIEKGTLFGAATPYERELAERILRHIPSMDLLRFVSTGTEAVMSALRVARAFTGKPLVVKFNGHFHGHADSCLVRAGSGANYLPGASSQGIPDAIAGLTASLPFNALEMTRGFLRSREDIAAVILEPIAANMGVVPAREDFLHMLREETFRKGIVLIFDEVVTGFRVGLGGAQALYRIAPDLTCLGKIIGGGLPAAAFGGRRDLMELLAPLGPVYQAGTYSGNPLAMRAGLATLKALEEPGFYQKLQLKTERFLEPLRQSARARGIPLTVHSAGSMFTLFFGVDKVESREDLALLDEERFKGLFVSLFKRGIYLSPSACEAHFLSSAHEESHLEQAQAAMLDYLKQ
jgi:glutamate-1-semialdehyde 2,1-aminomutase